MEFELSLEQKDIQRAAYEFAQKEFDPDLILELDSHHQFPHSIWKKASQLGFIGVHYPEEFGGQGLGLFENLLIIESFCKVDSGIGSALSLVDLGSEILLEFASHEQKKRWLTPLAKGEQQLSIAFGESEDENDMSSISTIVKERGDGYLINGKKRFVWNTDLANSFITLCKDDKERLMTFIIERETQGLEIRSVDKIGLRMVSFGDIDLKEICIPSENRIGEIGEAAKYVKHYFQNSSLRFLAQALGTAQGAFDRGLQYAKQRVQFGRKLIEFQVIRHKLAEMAIGVEVMRLLIYRLAIDCDQRKMDPKFFWITKQEVGRRLIEIVDEALQIFGGYGYMVEQPVEHYFRDTWAIISKLGTEEELKDSIANELFVPISKKK
jgi:alkylation response protein AidB-like acyl-CoA dehydrogenase